MSATLRRVVLAALAFGPTALLAPTLGSQESALRDPSSLGIVPGARVRLIAGYGDELQTGTLVAVHGDSVVFDRENTGVSQTMSFAHLVRLDVRRGLRARPFTGLGIGILAGLVGGAALGAATYRPGPNSCFSRLGCVGVIGFGHGGAISGALVGIPTGALVGLVIGTRVRSERWDTVPLNRLLKHARANIAVVPSAVGLRPAVEISARF